MTQRQMTQEEWIENLMRIVEKEDVSLEYYSFDESFELSFTTPNGGDERITLYAEDIDDHSELYDCFRLGEPQDDFINEYVSRHFNIVSGFPSVNELCEDAEFILNLYDTLYKKIANYTEEHPYKEVFGKEKEIEMVL